ncbi:response regulator [Paenibacillus filicis]|uniref:Response regulator n=1 Tax=Paenibacillus gyeongsangnamensis TaxID=3388067 RepID=A0ABT4QHU0_9BACL|nr:response regulator [Paenibacillus filicis]MCZ8516451.1 response regulator [Paenibacillus filicis]
MKAIIVDDEKHVREAIKLLVSWDEHGIDEVLEAQDGLDAIRLIEEKKPEIVFTDMMMPLKNGMELLMWLQQHAARAKTIVISGHDDFELVRHTMQHGGLDYILKPIDADQLEAAVKKAVSCWKKEEAERKRQQEQNMERNQYKPVYWEKIWSDSLTEPSGQSALRSSLDIGVSLTQPFPGGLAAAYGEAKTALRRRNLLSKTKEVHEYTAEPPPAKLLSFSEFAEGIRLAIRSGSEEQIRKQLDEWIASVRRLDRISIEQLEMWWYEYNAFRSRWLAELPGEQPSPAAAKEGLTPFSVPLDEQGTLSIELWREQQLRSLTELSRQFLRRQHQDSNVIYEIAKHIQNHYHQDITLQEIASHFYLSREYISRKFKQEFEVNLSDYISGIRMDKAKMLLLNPHLRISQVAQMVGYEDEKYFSKVFKKMVGQSPNEYRKENQP